MPINAEHRDQVARYPTRRRVSSTLISSPDATSDAKYRLDPGSGFHATPLVD